VGSGNALGEGPSVAVASGGEVGAGLSVAVGLGRNVGEGAAVAVALGAIVIDGRGVAVGICTVALASGGVDVPATEELHASTIEVTTANPPRVAAVRNRCLRLTGGVLLGWAIPYFLSL
jgi:hypothetical protein